MCTIVFAWDQHPRYRFVFAGNRDEFHARPATAADWWPQPPMLAGRDLQAGGTWLGIDKRGHFAVVTNFREGAVATPGTRSRGELVTAYFDSEDTELFREGLDSRADDYSGYNLLFGEVTSALYYHSNRGSSGGIGPGVHGLSNHLLDTPWPKVIRATAVLGELLARPVLQPELLLDLLSDRTQASSTELPSTGVSAEMEALLSSVFIASPAYGTRCSTAILLDREGRLQFVERRFDPDGTTAGESRFDFCLT